MIHFKFDNDITPVDFSNASQFAADTLETNNTNYVEFEKTWKIIAPGVPCIGKVLPAALWWPHIEDMKTV